MDEQNNTSTPVANPSSGGFPKWAIVLIVVLVVLSIAGYVVKNFLGKKIAENVVEKTIEAGTGAKVDLNSAGEGSLKVKSKDGELAVGTSAQWPSDMPSDVLKFSSGTIVAAIKTDNEQGKAWSVVVKDVEKSAVDAYLADLKAQGWKLISQVETIVSVNQLEKGIYRMSIAYDATSKGVNMTIEEKDSSQK
jgi:hypothetical protein